MFNSWISLVHRVQYLIFILKLRKQRSPVKVAERGFVHEPTCRLGLLSRHLRSIWRYLSDPLSGCGWRVNGLIDILYFLSYSIYFRMMYGWVPRHVVHVYLGTRMDNVCCPFWVLPVTKTNP